MLTDGFFLGTKLYGKNFSEFCEPLAKYLGIITAIYINIDKNGRAFSIFSDLRWAERFVEGHYYKVDPLMVHPDHMHNGFAFDEASDDQEFREIFYEANINFNWYHSFVYTEKNPEGGYFGFAFGTYEDNLKMVSRLINEAPLVKKMIRNLHKRLMLTTHDLQENKMDFASLKGDVYYTQKGLVFNEAYDSQRKIQLLNNLGFLSKDSHSDQDFLTNIILSPQEINCLRLYLTSHSLKTVSRDMGLALTTVTSYVENIKNKLTCHSKQDLFEKAEILESLGRI